MKNTQTTEEQKEAKRKRIAQAIEFDVLCARRAYSDDDPYYEWYGVGSARR